MTKQSGSGYKYIILIASILLQICLGATYAWSIFVEPLKLLLGKSQAQTQLPFTVFYSCFPITMLFSGFFIEKFGVRIIVILGALIFSSAWILAGFLGTNIPIIVILIGMMGGIGVGLAYLVPIKTCMQWFPKHKGLATGLAVAGFGGGSALLSQYGRYLMEVQHYQPLDVFKSFGIKFLILGTLCALLLKSPPGSNEKQEPSITLPEVLKDKFFWFLFLSMMAGLAGGFAIIANLKQIYNHSTALMGATAVSLFACFNALGRVTWGGLHDSCGGKKVIAANLIAQALLLTVGMYYLKTDWVYYLFAAIGGFNYGGVLVLYASEGGALWGPNKIPKVYGWIFFANMPASLAPLLAGALFDQFHTFNLAFLLLAIYILITAVILLFYYPGKDFRQPIIKS